MAVETPACFLAFDVLSIGTQDLRPAPFADRRRQLEELLAGVDHPVVLSPSTADLETAEAWLASADRRGFDGVVAKRMDDPYQPGKRLMIKVKRERTADCVVAGFRLYAGQPSVGSLLLGLYEGDELRHVGVVTSFTKARRQQLVEELAPLIAPLEEHPWRAGFALEGGPMGRLVGAAGRWTPDMPLDWVPLRIERVAEVAYTQLDGTRFRHPATFRRWRPDRDPGGCSIDQLLEEARA